MKFKASDIIYFKYPSKYTRSKDPKTVEAIIKIHSIIKGTVAYNRNDAHYCVNILKSVRGNVLDTEGYLKISNEEMYLFDTLFIDTYCRKLTPVEKVLYGS